MSLALLIVLVPFACAAVLTTMASARVRPIIDATSSILLFLLGCLLVKFAGNGEALLHAGMPERHLILLGSFIAMTTSWFSGNQSSQEPTGQSIDWNRARIDPVVSQAFIGAIMLALLSNIPALTWFALTVVVALGTALTFNDTVAQATAPFALFCGAGLLLALFGTLILHIAVGPSATRWTQLLSGTEHPYGFTLDLAAVLMVIGYGTVLWAVPLYIGGPDARGSAISTAIRVGILPVTVPLLVILRLRAVLQSIDPSVATQLILALGLAMLVLNGSRSWMRNNPQRSSMFAAMALIGVIVFALGLDDDGAMFSGLLLLILLALTWSVIRQCDKLQPTHATVWTHIVANLLFLALPPFALLLLAPATLMWSPWLLLPLGLGAMVTSMALIARVPLRKPDTAAKPMRLFDVRILGPIWLQLLMVLLLGVAMPGLAANWFPAMTEHQ